MQLILTPQEVLIKYKVFNFIYKNCEIFGKLIRMPKGQEKRPQATPIRIVTPKNQRVLQDKISKETTNRELNKA